ncbi:MAG TPA: hypothetical protein VIO57_11965 [Chloroflexota bacterium]
MRGFLGAAVLALMPALVGLSTASAATHGTGLSVRRHHAPPAPLTIGVTAGYGGQYRTSAWIPVRATIHNRTAGTISGTVTVPDRNGNANGGPSALYHTLYQAAVVLPAGTTKRVTLYVPGYDDLSTVSASFQPDDHAFKTVTAVDYPYPFQRQEISIGTLAADPQSAKWLNAITGGSSQFTVTRLTPATVDPVPESLANFDLIALTAVDASQLRQDQIGALESYVHNGGALILVGGPDWQETLGPLPSTLVPGTLAGSKTVSDLAGLRTVTGSAPPRGRTIISVLTHPRGTIRAGEGGVPLVVQRPIGSGQVLYLAFDPQVDPVAHWKARAALVTSLVQSAAPRAIGRANVPTSFNSGGPMYFCCGPVDLSSEVSNVPAAALPSLILFIVLTVFYVLLIGPLNFLVLRRLRRREWSWATIPALAALCMATTFGVAFHLKGNTVLINTVGTITLQGDHGPYPATVYAGLFAPLRGDYHLTYDRPSLPSVLAQPYFYNGPGSSTSNPVTLRFREGAQTHVDFLSMNMWSMREVSLRTSVNISGAVSSQLSLDSAGYLTGTIHNGTSLDLVHPLVLAGNAVARLPSLSSGGTVAVRLKPHGSTTPQTLLWMRLYGQPSPQQFSGGPMYYGQGFSSTGVPFLGNGEGCCPGPLPLKENNLGDRIRNVAAALPDTQMGTMPGEVTLLAWTQRSLGAVTVDGTVPQRRDLTLVMAPLSAHLKRGAFTLPTGVFSAQLMESSPGDSSNGGCCPFDPRVEPLYLNLGGSATFQFEIPSKHIHFRQLALDVNAGGAAGDDIGHVYNWSSGRWDPVNLSTGRAGLHHPNQYLSSRSTLLVKLEATNNSGAVVIGDVHRQLQISGAGTVD